MTQATVFSDPVALSADVAAMLPYNYLPAALPAMAADAMARNRVVMTFPQGRAGAALADPATRYAAIGVDTLKDPQATADFVAELQAALGPDVSAQRWFLGPPTEMKQTENAAPLTLAQPAWEPINQAEFDAAVVVIDSGIAFWNARFQGAAGPRFRSVRFLDFAQPLGAELPFSDIARLCRMQGGDSGRQIVHELRDRFPGSFYGSAAAQDGDGLWHGTAVADLAAGSTAVPADRIALFALELPSAVVEDYSGDSLTWTLAAALNMALAMTAGIVGKPVILVLPYGFSAGPQDGSHPAATIIANFLAVHAGRDLTILVSAGNQLQDRLRARLPGTQPNTAPLALDWLAPPDDFSPNCAEVLIGNVAPGDTRASLQIRSPHDGAVNNGSLKAGEYRLMQANGQMIGVLLRHANLNTTARLRFAILPTGHRPGAARAPHGKWQLSTLSEQPADIWVLRDDRDPGLDRGFPHRQSHFDHPMYRKQTKLGAAVLLDDPGSPVMRSGTLSVLATAAGVSPVQADERLGTQPQRQAEYSGRRNDGAALALHVLVDDGWAVRGTAAAANGSLRRLRLSGSSAATGLQARQLIGL